MSDDQESSTPVQQTEPGPAEPARPTGGRQRVYESAAERSRAWRERQREQREGRDAAPPSPSMAETTLGVLLDRLVELSGSHERAMGELSARIEGAIATLADPDTVARELATVRGELATGLRAAEDRVDEANRAKVTAMNDQREAETERDEAVEATAQAWDARRDGSRAGSGGQGGRRPRAPHRRHADRVRSRTR
ncbi:MAG: hypothetical protein ACYCV7_12200 [Acidimicrobiales bacterium]